MRRAGPGERVVWWRRARPLFGLECWAHSSCKNGRRRGAHVWRGTPLAGHPCTCIQGAVARRRPPLCAGRLRHGRGRGRLGARPLLQQPSARGRPRATVGGGCTGQPGLGWLLCGEAAGVAGGNQELWVARAPGKRLSHPCLVMNSLVMLAVRVQGKEQLLLTVVLEPGAEQQAQQAQQGPEPRDEPTVTGELLMLPMEVLEEAYEMEGSVLSVELLRSLSTRASARCGATVCRVANGSSGGCGQLHLLSCCCKGPLCTVRKGGCAVHFSCRNARRCAGCLTSLAAPLPPTAMPALWPGLSPWQQQCGSRAVGSAPSGWSCRGGMGPCLWWACSGRPTAAAC